MFCISLSECLETIKPREIYAASSPLGGMGVLSLAQQVKLVAVTSGPVFNKMAALEAIDNYNADIRFVPRIHTSLYKLVGDRVCWAAGPPLIRSTIDGKSTSVLLYACNKEGGLDGLFTGGKPIEAVGSGVLGGGRDGRDYDVVIGLRRLKLAGDDEEEVADKIIRSGAIGVDDLDQVSHIVWRIASRWRNRSAVVIKDPGVGLGITVSMIYYAVKAISTGQDCSSGRCIKTTAKLLERALRIAPSSRIHDAWREALKDPQTRRKIEESPYIPATLLLTGKVEVRREMSTKIYSLR